MARRFRGIPDSVIQAARNEYQVVLTSVDALKPIRCGRKVVGFYRPHTDKIGRRIGPIFVLPEHRGQGLAAKVYASIEGQLVACVRDDNPASVALHERSGFVRWKRYQAGWYWRRP
jgi:GNAT superfamily N-acetyltransferase